MNKLLLLSAAIFASINVYGQGSVVFQNNSATAVMNSVTGARVVAGNTFTAQLWYAPDGAKPTDAQMIPLLNPGDARPDGTTGISPVAGLITGKNRITPNTTAGGADAWFQVRVWESAYGTTWEAAQTTVLNGRQAIAGASNIFKNGTGNPGGNPPAPPVNIFRPSGVPGGLEGFSVDQIVPEPSIIGLGLLGAGSLLFLRRRR